jgi:hypothetical protein
MRRPLRFLPLAETAGLPHVVVDGSPNAGTSLVLTHWPGIPCPDGLTADTSAEMTFRYLDRGAANHGASEVVTNNHFDQDGAVGIFALVNPDAALEQRDLLEDLARAGDFATYRHRDAARMSMVLAAYADPERSPLGPAALSGPYTECCGVLYSEVLGRLPSLDRDLPALRDLWGEEDSELDAAEALVASGAVVIDEVPHVDLAVARVPEDAPARGGHRFAHDRPTGLHPMALHNATGRFRILEIRGRRYQLAFRYETWVQYRSRRPLLRVDLAPLADRLNEAEGGDVLWCADAVDNLTPWLRMADDAESRLDPERLLGLVVDHLERSPAAFNPYAYA